MIIVCLPQGQYQRRRGSGRPAADVEPLLLLNTALRLLSTTRILKPCWLDTRCRWRMSASDLTLSLQIHSPGYDGVGLL